LQEKTQRPRTQADPDLEFIQTVKQKSQFKREYATSLEANACRKREGADANSGRDRKGHNIDIASCALKEDGVLKLQKHPQFI
jgi:hypothetical protein